MSEIAQREKAPRHWIVPGQLRFESSTMQDCPCMGQLASGGAQTPQSDAEAEHTLEEKSPESQVVRSGEPAH
jgi:hypothetical protein